MKHSLCGMEVLCKERRGFGTTRLCENHTQKLAIDSYFDASWSPRRCRIVAARDTGISVNDAGVCFGTK